MKRKICIGLVLSATLVALGMTPCLTQGSSQYNEDGAVISANTTSPASAPWFIITVDSPNDVGQHVSVALDPASGTTYISYYDATYANLRMAQYVGAGGNCGPDNAWWCETVDSAGDVGKYSSIAVDPTDGYPIIAYYDVTNGRLKLAIGSGGGWIIKIIDDPLLGSTGLYASLKLDSTGKTRIAYYFSNLMGIDSLWYAKYVGGGAGNCTDNDYQCDPVDSGDQVGKYASLSLDSADRPRIAYYDEGNNALRYAFHTGASWEFRKILPTNAGKYASLYVDRNNGNLAHIAHYDSTNGKLGYAVYVGSNGNCGFNSSSTKFEWQCDEIDSVGTTTDPKGVSLAVDGANYPLIAYQSGGSGLKVARPAAALGLLVGNCGPESLFYTWQCEVIRLGIGIGLGDFLSLAVNPAGLATIAYYGNITTSDGDLTIAYQRLQVFLPLVLRQSP